MSFIAGYLLGLADSKKIVEIDPRIKKLDALEELYKIDIGEGWDIRIKIADDIDNMQYLCFAPNHGGIGDYITMWTLYYCVYLNDEFKFATCHNPFYRKYQENYQYADTPNRLYSITRTSGFQVTSAEATFKSGYSFLRVDVKGTYIESRTAYSWTNDGQRIEGETTDSNSSFSDSKDDFNGTQYNGCYIVNGNGDDFKNCVYGLYAVCKARALAEKS